MSEGQHAAEDTKEVLHEAYNATEDVRKNINSFADDLIGGNKTHKSTGFSNDAKALGKDIDQSVGSTNTGAHTSTGQPATTTTTTKKTTT